MSFLGARAIIRAAVRGVNAPGDAPGALRYNSGDMQSGAIEFSVETSATRHPLTFATDQLVCCGWTARDRADAERHIEELARLGVPRPTTIPIYIRLPRRLITTSDVIEVGSATTSGEVECVLLDDGARRWLTVGSDHTDRHIETMSIVASKQMCGKYIAPVCWAYDGQAALRSAAAAVLGDTRWPHRPVSGRIRRVTHPAARPPRSLPGGLATVSRPGAFCGTIPTISDVAYGDRYNLELHDPVLKRTIHGSYHVEVLPQRI